MNKQQHPRGVTLLELLIVIIIVGILAAIAIPRFTDIPEKEKGNACINNMRVILAAWAIYNMKNPAGVFDPNGAWSDLEGAVGTAINPTLGSQVRENNFGDNLGISNRFNMDYTPPPGLNTPNYYIETRRITDVAQDIICRYYPNGITVGGNTYHYQWSGAWPWLPVPPDE